MVVLIAKTLEFIKITLFEHDVTICVETAQKFIQ
jgi:hypothetical protein